MIRLRMKNKPANKNLRTIKDVKAITMGIKFKPSWQFIARLIQIEHRQAFNSCR